MNPPPYPRLPHLTGGRGTRDDLVLAEQEKRDLLAADVVVEEKLDGANVVVWQDDSGRIDVTLRSGPGGMDRGGQLGPLRAWAAAHDAALRASMTQWPVLYGEWLLLTHSVAYDRLPAYLVVLDLWRPTDGFAQPDERNEVSRSAGLSTPPELWRGVPGILAALEARLGGATWGTTAMEGVVVRRLDNGAPRLAKLVGQGFDQIDDHTWRAGRPRNRLAEGEVSWH